jgi:hypothetical protein
MTQTIRSSTIAALTTAAALAFTAAPAGATIVVGKSIGGLKLGMTQAQARARLEDPPKKTTVANEITGPQTKLAWQGIFALFITGDALNQVETTLPTERTPSGVGVGSKLAKVHSALTGETCSNSAGVYSCRIGGSQAGDVATDFFFKGGAAGRVNRVVVGTIVD